MVEFKLPEFLQETEEETHERMILMAPPNYDTSEGSLYWDHTRPTARVKDRLVGYELTIALMMAFPQFAEGPFLDWHGEPIGVFRRKATPAAGAVTLTGTVGTVIPPDAILTTIGDDNEASYLYRLLESGVIDETGTITLRVEAVEPGTDSNVPIGSIVGVTKSIKGLQAITNAESVQGGAPEEDDESYRQRIISRNQNKPLSGSRGDYERWAKEVPGVGSVIVLPLWDGPKTVKVLITDTLGQIASPELIVAVKKHIDPDDGLGGGLAPIGAVLTVDTIAAIPIIVKLSLVMEDGYLLPYVLQNIKDNLNAYFADKKTIKWAEAVAVVVGTEGVSDHSGLLLNDAMNNITLGIGERAVVSEVLAS